MACSKQKLIPSLQGCTYAGIDIGIGAYTHGIGKLITYTWPIQILHLSTVKSEKLKKKKMVDLVTTKIKFTNSQNLVVLSYCAKTVTSQLFQGSVSQL